MQFSLLYRGSRDGWMFKDFHQRCDNQGPTLTLFKSSKEKICGGYTSISWNTDGTNHVDNSAFLFSVSLKKKYLSEKDEVAV
jgi:hypothetical protein